MSVLPDPHGIKRILPENGTVQVCNGVVRWVPLSSMQAHRRKLQQEWSVITTKDGKVVEIRREWRDVPSVEEEP